MGWEANEKVNKNSIKKMVFMLMWTDEGYFEQLFWKKPSFNIKFGNKPILAQNLRVAILAKKTKFWGKIALSCKEISTLAPL